MSEKRKPLSEKDRGQNQDIFRDLDAEAAAMLETREIQAIAGQGEEWWCPNPDCEIVEK